MCVCVFVVVVVCVWMLWGCCGVCGVRACVRVSAVQCVVCMLHTHTRRFLSLQPNSPFTYLVATTKIIGGDPFFNTLLEAFE